MRFRTSLAAGLIDSAVASLATFVIGLFAARHLTLDELGIYGLSFAGFIFAGSVPALLVFTPVEVELLGEPPAQQVGALPRSLRYGLVSAISAAAVASGVVLLLERSNLSASLPIIVGAFAAAVLSPLQDHVRRMLHQVNWNWAAAVMSVTQLAVAGSTLIVLNVAGVPTAWLPFGALATANLVSGTVGLVLASRRWERPSRDLLDPRSLSRVGVWLLFAGSMEQAAQFAGLTILTVVAGRSVVGNFEATRVLSQPMYVIATGLLSVVSPRVMAASKARDRHEAIRYSTAFLAVLGAVGVTYLVAAGVKWPGNPLVELFPNAYVSPGLMPAMILATLIGYGGIVLRQQVIAAGRQRVLARFSLVASIVYVVTMAALARPIEAFAVPTAFLVFNVLMVSVFVSLLRRWYGFGHLADAERRWERALRSSSSRPSDEGAPHG